MIKGRHRNALCWCNSGKKFKKCHYNRAEQSKENSWLAFEANRKAFQAKKCFAFGGGLGECKGSIVKAHTVSRSSNLAAIAKDGHVIRYSVNADAMKRNSAKLSAELIGIRNASVFNGFCAFHDRVLFSCIENTRFTGRPDQCLAVAYRTLSREVHGKDASSHIRETLRSADKGRPFEAQVALQTFLEGLNIGNEAARRDLSGTHRALSEALAENRTDVIRSLILRFDNRLPFMFAGAWSPLFDLSGQALQAGFSDELLEQVFFSSFADLEGDFICISWRVAVNAPGALIADQIAALPTDQQAAACLQFVTKHVENIFFDPDWFEGLDQKQREILDRLAMDGVDAMGSPPSLPISFNETFQLPSVTRSTIV